MTCTFSPTIDPDEIQARKILLRKLYDFYSDTGRSYRSLNRSFETLQECPPYLRQYTKLIHLQRPMRDKLELSVLLAAVGACSLFGKELSQVWHRARHGEILRAMDRVSQILHNQEVRVHEYIFARDGCLSPDIENDIKFFAIFLVSFGPEKHQGTITGLADRACERFQAVKQARRAQVVERLGTDRQLKAPPIRPPKDIELIATVGRLAREGDFMDNCIMDYCEDAIAGLCFVFHVEKDGTHATALIGYDGKVVECRGRGHKDNAASELGLSRLAFWRVKLYLLDQGKIRLQKFWKPKGEN